MDDLKQAIKNLLEHAAQAEEIGKIGNCYLINWNYLHTLQAEYNIHFVEPEQEQLDVL